MRESDLFRVASFLLYLSIQQINALLADKGKLTDILKYHVVKLFVKVSFSPAWKEKKEKGKERG